MPTTYLKVDMMHGHKHPHWKRWAFPYTPNRNSSHWSVQADTRTPTITRRRFKETQSEDARWMEWDYTWSRPAPKRQVPTRNPPDTSRVSQNQLPATKQSIPRSITTIIQSSIPTPYLEVEMMCAWPQIATSCAHWSSHSEILAKTLIRHISKET